MANSNYTLRNLFEAVIEADFDAEATAMAEKQIAKMDATNAKRREKAALKAVENNENFDKFMGVLTSEPKTATQIAEMLDGVIVREKGLTPQYIAKLAKVGVDNGTVVKSVVKIDGEKAKRTVYALA